MQTKGDLARTRPGGRGRRRKPRPPGGKALQRLFAFLGQRDPALNDDVIATVPVPKTVRPAYAVTTRALHAKPLTAARVARARPRVSAAKPLATSLGRAAASLSRSRRARPPQRRMAMRPVGTAIPPGAGGVWQELGPTRITNGQTYGTNRVDVIGRVASIAVDPGDPTHLLLGAAGGGIWESRDTGATWTPRGDQLPSLAIGAVAFDPTAPTRAYAGSGEGNFYSSLGAGVYKSTDGGATWTVAAGAPFVGVGFFDL